MGLGVSGYFQVSQSVVQNPNSEPLSAEQVGKRSQLHFKRQLLAVALFCHFGKDS